MLNFESGSSLSHLVVASVVGLRLLYVVVKD